MNRKSLGAVFSVFLLSLALVSGLAVSPSRAIAQAAPAAQASQPQAAPAEAGQKKAESGGSESGGVDEQQFRHTSLVTTIGKALGLDVETTARIFEWINFAIIFFAIVIPIVRFLPRALKRRQSMLDSRLAEARKTTADANSRLSAVEAQLSKLDGEIAKIRAQVEDEIKNDEARIKASLGEESQRIVAAAEQEIAVAAAQAQRSLKAFAADLAIDQAVKQLTLTAEHDRALIEEFVADAGKGGKN